MDKINDTAGVILAGGRSSRFGSNKALALIDGRPLIQHVSGLILGLFQECLLVTNTPEVYAFLSLPMTPDRYRGKGPLAGIHAALLNISRPRAFVVACDMPSVSPALIRYLCSVNGQEYDAIIPWLGSGQEPLYGIYHKRALKVIESLMQKNLFPVIRALEDLKVRWVTEEEVLSVTGNLNCFKNINRPEDI